MTSQQQIEPGPSNLDQTLNLAIAHESISWGRNVKIADKANFIPAATLLPESWLPYFSMFEEGLFQLVMSL